MYANSFPSFGKVVSGDDDLPKKDDIGERRRKHELQVLARAGVESEDGAGYDIEDAAESDGDVEMDEDNETEDSEDEFYKQAKQQRAAKLAAKAEIHSRCVIAISCQTQYVVFLCIKAFPSACVGLAWGRAFFSVFVVGSMEVNR